VDTTATGEVKEVSIEAVITRADGTVEDLGVISIWKAEDEPDHSVAQRIRAALTKRMID
jgi:hypothetical protein